MFVPGISVIVVSGVEDWDCNAELHVFGAHADCAGLAPARALVDIVARVVYLVGKVELRTW